MIKNRQVPETIPEIQDFYYGKSVIKISFKSKPYAQGELRKVHSKRPPSNVGPQSGCVIVLDSSSISQRWLYEASGYKVATAIAWQGGVSASIYCLEENQAEAEIELLKAVKEAAEKASMDAEYILRSYQSAIDSVPNCWGKTMNKNATKRHYKSQKILVKYIVKIEPIRNDSLRTVDGEKIRRLIVFFPGERANADMICYLGCSWESAADDDLALPMNLLTGGEASMGYYLECKPVKLTPAQLEKVEARILQCWPEADREEIELKRVSKVTAEDREMMWR